MSIGADAPWVGAGSQRRNVETSPRLHLGLGAPLGVETPWVGFTSTCGSIHCLGGYQRQRAGPFNVVAPEHASNALLSTCLAGVGSRPHWAPAVPRFALHLAMGSMSSLLLEGRPQSHPNCNKLASFGSIRARRCIGELRHV